MTTSTKKPSKSMSQSVRSTSANKLTQAATQAMQSYLLMKISLEQFGKIISELEVSEHQKLLQILTQTIRLYTAVLSSKQALNVVVTEKEVNSAIDKLKARFANHQDFINVLTANQLDEASLTLALRNELHSETTLAYISKDCPVISEEAIQAYYFKNLNKFAQPERRAASHLLITLNDEFFENTPVNVFKRMKNILKDITPTKFAWFAQRYSECPTAMNKGHLGLVAKGQLHKELDANLFKMKANAISDIIETEAGLHILWCEKIHPPHTISYEQAKEKIIEQHLNRDRKRMQKQWIASLLSASH